MYKTNSRPTVTIGKELKMFGEDKVIKEEYGIIHYAAKLEPIKSNNDLLKPFSVRFTCDDGVVIEMCKRELFNLYTGKLLGHYYIHITYFANNKYINWSMKKEDYTSLAEQLKILPDFETLLDIVLFKKKLVGKKYLLKSLKHTLEYYRHTN